VASALPAVVSENEHEARVPSGGWVLTIAAFASKCWPKRGPAGCAADLARPTIRLLPTMFSLEPTADATSDRTITPRTRVVILGEAEGGGINAIRQTLRPPS
jgi:hypothetical protein